MLGIRIEEGRLCFKATLSMRPLVDLANVLENQSYSLDGENLWCNNPWSLCHVGNKGVRFKADAVFVKDLYNPKMHVLAQAEIDLRKANISVSRINRIRS